MAMETSSARQWNTYKTCLWRQIGKLLFLHTFDLSLIQTNSYKELFLHAFEILERTPSRDLTIQIVADPSTDLRQYNVPIVDEIAIIISGDLRRAVNPCDIILHR